MDNVITGRNFEVTPECAILFDARGLRINDDVWAFNVRGDEWCLPIVPTPISPTIRTCIDIDRRNGNGHRIAQLCLNPKSAVLYFLEGGLRIEHFQDAVEVQNEYVQILGMNICGRQLSLMIISGMESDVSTADVRGVLIQ